MSAPAASAPTGFATQLRAATAPFHAAAEGSGLAERLVAGEVDVDGYAVLVVQLRAVYAALEEVARGVADDPDVGPLMDPRLERTVALDHDLAWLRANAHGPVDDEVLPATAAYVDRLGEVAGWPGGVVAHHYTRYLGDLSGGIVIGRALGRALGGGVDFYRFPADLDARSYKIAYRERLDAAAWASDQRAAITGEVVVAYEHNRAVFDAVHERILGCGAPTQVAP